MRQVFRIDKDGYFIEPIMLQDGEPVPNDCVTTEYVNGFYTARFVNGEWVEGRDEQDILNEKKQIKKQELSVFCNLSILAGFTSDALGTTHTYPSDEEAQRNFHTELFRILIDPTYDTIYFKTLDSGYLPHTKEQFFKVFSDGHDGGKSLIAKLNKLKATLDGIEPTNTTDSNTVISEVNSIQW